MSEPNKLLGVHIHHLHKDPLLGLMDLETDEGMIEVAINRAIAELLIEQLQGFLASGKLK
jgi:hypothetical protein